MTDPRPPGTSPEAVLGVPTTEAETVALLALRGLARVGDRGVRRLLEVFGTAESALAARSEAFAAAVGPEAARGRGDPGPRTRAELAVRAAAERGLSILTVHDRGYPSRLRELADPPSVLFLVGAPALLQSAAVAVVGSRAATEGGRRSAERLGRALAGAGFAVVSGLALGIDAAAHRGALAGSGKTVAVLGGGADRASPRANEPLYRAIRERGLIVSEFLPGDAPLPHNFPRRNRILAALSRAVVVVEAAERSGALITVDHALDLGRDVFAVPGPVRSPQSRGTNALIRDGARILLDPDQLLEELGGVRGNPAAGVSSGPPAPEHSVERRLWNALDGQPRHVDVLARSAGLDAATAVAGLATLEVEGWAMRSPGLRFARADDRTGSA